MQLVKQFIKNYITFNIIHKVHYKLIIIYLNYYYICSLRNRRKTKLSNIVNNCQLYQLVKELNISRELHSLSVHAHTKF